MLSHRDSHLPLDYIYDTHFQRITIMQWSFTRIFFYNDIHLPGDYNIMSLQHEYSSVYVSVLITKFPMYLLSCVNSVSILYCNITCFCHGLLADYGAHLVSGSIRASLCPFIITNMLCLFGVCIIVHDVLVN